MVLIAFRVSQAHSLTDWVVGRLKFFFKMNHSERIIKKIKFIKERL